MVSSSRKFPLNVERAGAMMPSEKLLLKNTTTKPSLRLSSVSGVYYKPHQGRRWTEEAPQKPPSVLVLH